MDVRKGILGVMVLFVLCVGGVWALHSPKEWYRTTDLDDSNRNKIEDMLEEVNKARAPDEPVDIFVCFVDDCRPEERLGELAQMASVSDGELGYASTVVASVVVKNILPEFLPEIARWSEVGYIHQDHPLVYTMTTAGQSLKAHAGFYTGNPTTAENENFDGSGITIAILDSGVDDPGGAGTTHTHLPTAVSAPGVGGLFITAADALAFGNPDDTNSHGTAVAGCALGRGDGAGNNRGVAPAASLFDCRVSTPAGALKESNMQQIVDWLTWNHNNVTPPVRVASMSVAGMCESAGSALTASLEALVASGVFVCVAIGNHDNCPTYPLGGGATCTGGVGHIAVATRVTTVAAASHENTTNRNNDVIANYSRLGPGIGLSPKPDITAYGNQCPITCASPGSCAGASTSVIRAPNFNSMTGYRNFGGTSAATPMVAGAAALLIERNPAISPAAIKDLLMNTAEDMGPAGWDATWGAGLMDLGPTFAAPPPGCDLRVSAVTYDPTPVECFNPVDITITVQNMGGTSVSDFLVDWERWYFGPGQPAQRFPIGAGPEANGMGPLMPGASRNFTRTWTPGVSDDLPLSAHSCFWGIVHAACDTNASNNERNVNITIGGVSGSECEARAGEMVKHVPIKAGEVYELPFRLGHTEPGGMEMLLTLENPDEKNYGAELQVMDHVGQEIWAYVNNQECAVWGTLRVYPWNPEAPPPAMQIRAFDDQGNPINDMEVVIDVLGDQDRDEVPDGQDNCPGKQNPEQEDEDKDGRGDVCDNCPETYNPDQADRNANGIGDACDDEPLCQCGVVIGDLDLDCDVDLDDFGAFAANWLAGK